MILYCVTYGLSCATKHVGRFWVLAVGRILGGVAYSVLWSGFESWFVCEFYRLGGNGGLKAGGMDGEKEEGEGRWRCCWRRRLIWRIDGMARLQ